MVKVEVQEGLYLIKSKFGWIISGKTKTNERIHHENTMFIMAHSPTQVLPELQHFSNTDDSMPALPNIDNFWKLETILLLKKRINMMKLLWSILKIR